MSIDDHAVFVIGRIRIRDTAKWILYRDGVAATLVPFDGAVVARGHDAWILTGASDETDMVVLRFPSRADADAWYASDAYQALIPLRDQAADVTIVGYRL